MKKMNVIELFAGVGGFRLGLEHSGHYKVVWSNQWEPSTKTQHASLVYEARFGSENHSNEDIAQVSIDTIPDADLLVGGFPCQDYSVATTLQNSKGLIGKKGVLWWSIHRILSEKKHPPSYLFLENVDRLLKSPSSQRGRDFAIILKSLDDLGYAVEWRVINAADYGMPQRRRRVFILAYHRSTVIYKQLEGEDPTEWIHTLGTLAHSFPVVKVVQKPSELRIDRDLVSLSKNFNKRQKLSPFENSGIFINGTVFTSKTLPNYDGPRIVLGDILQNGEVTEDFFLPTEDLPKWEYLKGSKKEIRTSKNGHSYHYSEGSMIFPDALDKASRTIITGEGGKSASRFKHVIATKKGLRRLTPVELERLNMFPDNHTQLRGISDSKRAFFMGNALVVGVIEKIGASLYEKINL
ncbi:DNA (cytosine-5-)-methyltransferase [Flavobacteriaceae bacterium TP-CH-4]|uniref:Cytosine-specific methyltransferase n=1 Tax=Pelagihabitans pacificus TaxID=2696054 RepID=A0A967AYS6_9FLAO|nr:DNA (cytosine-5-)-methyltransferase [Pelagihabitans pacificus]NHF59036.1 DNA (cytosine-5-)-methyltransferase [Pelagihabitans pacificus]